MEIKIAKKAGFCMGVRRALNLVLKALNEGKKPIYTFGPLIHNPQTLELLKKLGVEILKKPEEKVPSGICIIRAHGIPPEERELLKKRHFLIDGTCPRVLKVQGLAKNAVEQGKEVVIVGDKEHAEVKGILGFCKGKGYVVSSWEDLEKLPPLKEYLILSQTTQDQELFYTLASAIKAKYPKGEVINTICNATEIRQREVRRLCKECSTIIVIGGKFSANTKRLAQIAEEEGAKVYLIEKPEELPLSQIKKLSKIGITAGASTPNWLINEVVNKIKTQHLLFKIFQIFFFLSFTQVLSFILLVLSLVNFLISNPDKKTFLLILFSSFLLLFHYNFYALQNNISFLFYYPSKQTFFLENSHLIKAFLIFLIFSILLTGFLIEPKWVFFFLCCLILEKLFLKNFAYFLLEILLLFLLFFSFPINYNLFSFNLLLQLILILVFLRLYLELVYLHTDGFLPKEFWISLFSFEEKRILKVLKILLGVGILLNFFLLLKNPFFFLNFLTWLLAYFILFLLTKKPLGQIFYLEFLLFVPPVSLFILSILFKILF